MAEKVVITKLGSEAPVSKKATTHKVIPRSILKTAKVRPTSDPSKSPPVKKSMRKHTIRLLTDKGSKRHRKTLRRKIAKLSDEKIKDIASRSGLLKNNNTPVSVLRQMVEGGAVAGFLSI
jgi:predicted type IV restriction endonuclease